jgi:alanine racemase
MQAATVVINRRALRHNLQRLRELAPASKMVAVVKANAYGHGLLETARTLPDADAFGVARLEEALRLRAGGITKPVLLLEGFFDARDLPTISAQHFHTAVHNEEQLAALEEASLDEPVTSVPGSSMTKTGRAFPAPWVFCSKNAISIVMRCITKTVI